MRGRLRRLVVVAALEDADTGEAVADVEGVRDLAEFAVADAVDAGGDLSSDDIMHRGSETGVERRLLERPSDLAGFEKLHQIGRPRQTADMGRQDALGAVLHPPSPPLSPQRERAPSPRRRKLMTAVATNTISANCSSLLGGEAPPDPTEDGFRSAQPILRDPALCQRPLLFLLLFAAKKNSNRPKAHEPAPPRS